MEQAILLLRTVPGMLSFRQQCLHSLRPFSSADKTQDTAELQCDARETLKHKMSHAAKNCSQGDGVSSNGRLLHTVIRLLMVVAWPRNQTYIQQDNQSHLILLKHVPASLFFGAVLP